MAGLAEETGLGNGVTERLAAGIWEQEKYVQRQAKEQHQKQSCGTISLEVTDSVARNEEQGQVFNVRRDGDLMT